MILCLHGYNVKLPLNTYIVVLMPHRRRAFHWPSNTLVMCGGDFYVLTLKLVPRWDLDVNLFWSTRHSCAVTETTSQHCILYTNIPTEWLPINCVPCCILLCVFPDAVTFVHEQCCHRTLQAKLCVFVMYEISIDFSLHLKTIKHNKRKKNQGYFAVTESMAPVLSLSLTCLVLIYITEKRFSLLRV